MIKRLEQVAALVVAAGLALVSYWLFFSWAQGGGAHRRQKPGASSSLSSPRLLVVAAAASQPSASLEEPLLGGAVFQARDVVPHLFAGDRQPQLGADLNDAAEGTTRVLQGLAKEGLGEGGIFTDPGVQRGGVGGGHRGASIPPEAIALSPGVDQAARERPSSSERPLAEASSMLRASRQSTLRSWA